MQLEQSVKAKMKYGVDVGVGLGLAHADRDSSGSHRFSAMKRMSHWRIAGARGKEVKDYFSANWM